MAVSCSQLATFHEAEAIITFSNLIENMDLISLGLFFASVFVYER